MITSAADSDAMRQIGFVKELKKIGRDEHGSIEGLPLQLMIMGIIASLGTAVIMGWVSSIETPVYVGHIEIDPAEIILNDGDADGIFQAEFPTLTFKVVDTSGNSIAGVHIIVEGQSIDNARHRLYGTTDSYGYAQFEDIAFKVDGDRPCELSVSVSGQAIASDYWTEILVLPE